MADFEFTADKQVLSNKLWEVTSAVGAGICFLVLLIIGVAMVHPVSRNQLDRVSFRIVIYALIANMVFGIASAICGSQTEDGFSCGFSMWILMLTFEISTFLLFCVGLNLQLALVHGVNGQRMEKWYTISSVGLALALTVPTYALKHYGWDPLNQACWYRSPDPKERLKWQIGTQTFWSVACSAGEVIMFFIVLWHMLRHQVLHSAAIRSRSRSASTATGTRSGGSSGLGSSITAHSSTNHAKTYRAVIARIALYPLASLVINAVTVACDLVMSTSDSVQTLTQYQILLLNDFCYGGRPVVYALLAATDPALVRALSALWKHVRGGKDDSTVSIENGTTQSQITVHIALKQVRHTDDGQEVPLPTGSLKDSGPAAVAEYASPLKDEEASFSDNREVRLEAMRRGQINRALEMKQQAREARLARLDFKKQI